jgi:hypothetical protein
MARSPYFLEDRGKAFMVVGDRVEAVQIDDRDSHANRLVGNGSDDSPQTAKSYTKVRSKYVVRASVLPGTRCDSSAVP